MYFPVCSHRICSSHIGIETYFPAFLTLPVTRAYFLLWNRTGESAGLGAAQRNLWATAEKPKHCYCKQDISNHRASVHNFLPLRCYYERCYYDRCCSLHLHPNCRSTYQRAWVRHVCSNLSDSRNKVQCIVYETNLLV